MLGKKENGTMERTGNLNTIIGKGTFFEGTLKVESSIRIDGKIKGRIITADALTVGKDGEVEGEVTAKNAIVGGKVQGKVHSSGKVVLEAQSLFQGELKTAKLVIEEGAVFEGVCSMGQKDSSATNVAGKSLLSGPSSAPKKEPIKQS
ncbi:MAG: polymer-forming cytoskeletal protein [Deferribacteres bacterium]|nr:polymer-forming cytoskeletal protein [candidate division KSB1 bacterium]MCB9502975.1 polymer-forming cytoskeletal protein [Deferribacteres bacterium]